MSEGYVYVLLNPSLRAHRYKIGMTTKTPAARAAEISSATGVPEPFEVAFSRKVRDCGRAEHMLKEKLEERRVSTRREFYDIALEDAVDLLNSVAREVGVLDDGPRQAAPREHAPMDRPSANTPADAQALAAEFTIHVPPNKARRTGISHKRGRKSIEEHLAVCNAEIRALFEAFRVRVNSLAPHIQENCWSYGVAYRASQNFVELYFRSNRLEICLRPTVYRDPEHLLGKVPESYNWTLNRRFLLEDARQLEYLIPLVKQSYENVA